MCAWYDESGILSRSPSRSPLLTLGLAQLMQCLQSMRGGRLCTGYGDTQAIPSGDASCRTGLAPRQTPRHILPML